MQINQSLIDALGFNLDQAIADHSAALDAHALTVDEPAPIAHPLVEAIVRAGGYSVVDDPESSPPSLVPRAISDRQFFQELAIRGVISKAEALAAVKTGTLPADLQAAVDAIEDEDQRFSVDMQLSGATTFERNHPTTPALGAALGYDAAALDDLWTSAAAL